LQLVQGELGGRRQSDSTDLTSRVTAAIANGRHVRCYLLAADPDAQPREEKYLVAKGYRRGSVAA
jgi:hypothetical protein